MNTQIQTSEAKGKPLTLEENALAVSILKAISYRIRHSDPQEINGKLTASYYITQGLMNACEYLTFPTFGKTNEPITNMNIIKTSNCDECGMNLSDPWHDCAPSLHNQPNQ